jgi:hypothetical protein
MLAIRSREATPYSRRALALRPEPRLWAHPRSAVRLLHPLFVLSARFRLYGVLLRGYDAVQSCQLGLPPSTWASTSSSSAGNTCIETGLENTQGH